MGLYVKGRWDGLSKIEKYQVVGTDCAVLAANRHDWLSELGHEFKVSFPGFEMVCWGREEEFDFEN